MKIITFGDSWTSGEGTNHSITRKWEVNEMEKMEQYNKSHSWTRYLADKIGVQYKNFGETGSTNYRIFSNVFEQFAQDQINKDDLVIIMWSSPLRDPLPFFPHMFSKTGPIGLSWSLKELATDSKESLKRYYDHWGKTNKQWITYMENDLIKFMDNYFPFYLENLHDESYYKLLNTNYMIMLEKYLKSKGIDYIMCNAFEELNYDKKLVDITNYYNHQTMFEFLSNKGEVWEDTQSIYTIKHPNTQGHKLIAEELFDFYESIYRVR